MLQGFRCISGCLDLGGAHTLGLWTISLEEVFRLEGGFPDPILILCYVCKMFKVDRIMNKSFFLIHASCEFKPRKMKNVC